MCCIEFDCSYDALLAPPTAVALPPPAPPQSGALQKESLTGAKEKAAAADLAATAQAKQAGDAAAAQRWGGDVPPEEPEDATTEQTLEASSAGHLCDEGYALGTAEQGRAGGGGWAVEKCFRLCRAHAFCSRFSFSQQV